ncbi:hypothetical protein Esti_002368 [Eimeria stiedai]
MERSDLFTGDFPRSTPTRKPRQQLQQDRQQQQQQQQRKSRAGKTHQPTGNSSSSSGTSSQLSFPFLHPAAAAAVAADGEQQHEEEVDLDGVSPAAAAAALRAPLKEGSLLLAVVAEVHASELLLQLPHGLMGYVHRSHTLEPQQEQQQQQQKRKQQQQQKRKQQQQPGTAYEQQLLQRFFVGQLLPCVVIGTPNSSSSSSSAAYGLSLRPSLFNAGLSLQLLQRGMLLPATVSSIEEHGLLLCFGLQHQGSSSSSRSSSSVRAFLPQEQQQLLQQQHNTLLLPGSLVAVVLQEVNVGSKSVICAAPAAATAAAARPQLSPLALQHQLAWSSIRPGLLVECRVVRPLLRHSANSHKRREMEGASSSSSKSRAAAAAADLNSLEGLELKCLSSVKAVALHPHIVHPTLLQQQREQQQMLLQRCSKDKSKGGGEQLQQQQEADGSSKSSSSAETEQEQQQQLDSWLLQLLESKKQQQQVYGRVVALLPQQRIVFVSLLPHVVGWQQQLLLQLLPPHLLFPGTRIKASLPVLNSSNDDGQRALLLLPKLLQQLLQQACEGAEEAAAETAAGSSSSSSGFQMARFAMVRIPASLSAAAAVSTSKRKRQQQQQQQQISRCRLLYVHWFDVELVAAAAEALLSAELLSPLDAAPGDVCSGSILKAVKAQQRSSKQQQQQQQQRVEQQEAGVTVRLSASVRGWVPLCCFSDVPLQQLPQDAAAGAAVTVRVLRRFCCSSCDFLEASPAAAAAALSGRCYNSTSSSSSGCARPGGEELSIYPISSSSSSSSSRFSVFERGMLAAALMCLGGGGGGRLLLTRRKALLKLQEPLLPLPLQSSAAAAAAEALQHRPLLLQHVQPSIRKGRLLLGYALLPQRDVQRAAADGTPIKLGSLLKVVVTGVNLSRGTLEVSTDLSKAAAADSSSNKNSLSSSSSNSKVLSVGTIVPGTSALVVSVHQNGVLLLLPHCSRPVPKRQQQEDHDQQQQQQEQQQEAGVLGFVQTLHLADEVSVALSLHRTLKIGARLPFEAIVIAAAAAVSPGPTQCSAASQDAKERSSNSNSSGSSATDPALVAAAAAAQQELQQQEHLRDICLLSCKPSLCASARAFFSLASSSSSGSSSRRLKLFARSSAELQRLHASAGLSPLLLWGYVRQTAAFGAFVSLGAMHAQAVCPFRHLSADFIETGPPLCRRLPPGLTVKAALLPQQQQQQQQHVVELRAPKLNKIVREQTKETALAAAALPALQGMLQQRAAAAAAAAEQQEEEACCCSKALKMGTLQRCFVESVEGAYSRMRVVGCCLGAACVRVWVPAVYMPLQLQQQQQQQQQQADCLIVAANSSSKVAYGCCSEEVLQPFLLLRDTVRRQPKGSRLLLRCTLGGAAAADEEQQQQQEEVVVRLRRDKKKEEEEAAETDWFFKKDAMPPALLRMLEQRLQQQQQQQLSGFLAADMGLLAVAAAMSEEVQFFFPDEDAAAVCLRFPLFLLTLSPFSNNQQHQLQQQVAVAADGSPELIGCPLNLFGPLILSSVAVQELPLLLLPLCCRPREASEELAAAAAAAVAEGGLLLQQIEKQQAALRQLAPAAALKTPEELQRGAVVRCQLIRVSAVGATARLLSARFPAEVYIHPADALPPLPHQHQHQQQQQQGGGDSLWAPPRLAGEEALPPSPLLLLQPQQELYVTVLGVHRFSSSSSSSESEEDEEGDILASFRKLAQETLVISAGLFQLPAAAAAAKKQKQIQQQQQQNQQPQMHAEWGIIERTLPGHLFVSCGWSSSTGQLELQQQQQEEEGQQQQQQQPRRRGCVSLLDASSDREGLKAFEETFKEGRLLLLRQLPPLRCTDTALSAAGAEAVSSSVSVRDRRRFLVVGPCPEHTQQQQQQQQQQGGGVRKRGLRAPPSAQQQRVLLRPRLSSAATAQIPAEVLEHEPFQSVKEALLAVQRWRYPEGCCCSGRVQQLLLPPFAVSVQLTQLLLQAESSKQLVLRLPLLVYVHLTELTDEWLSQPMQHMQLAVGQYVRLKMQQPPLQQQQQQQVRLQATLRLQAEDSGEEDTAGAKKRKRRAAQRPRPNALEEIKVSNSNSSSNSSSRSSSSSCRSSVEDVLSCCVCMVVHLFFALQEGDSWPGLVVTSGPSGIFAALSRSLTLRIQLRHAGVCAPSAAESDGSSGLLSPQEVKRRFPPGCLLPEIHILKVDYVKKRIEGSLRPIAPESASARGRVLLLQKLQQQTSPAAAAAGAAAAGDLEPLRQRLLQCLKKGQVLVGTVRRVEGFGVFVRLSLFNKESPDEGPAVELLQQQQQQPGKKKTAAAAAAAEQAAAALQQLRTLQQVAVDGLCPINRLGLTSSPEERNRRLSLLNPGDLVQAKVVGVRHISNDPASSGSSSSSGSWPSVKVEITLDPAELPAPEEDEDEVAHAAAAAAATAAATTEAAAAAGGDEAEPTEGDSSESDEEALADALLLGQQGQHQHQQMWGWEETLAGAEPAEDSDVSEAAEEAAAAAAGSKRKLGKRDKQRQRVG